MQQSFVKLRGSQHVLHPVPMRVKGQGQEQNSTKRLFFFLKRLEFPEATKIIAFSRNAQTKADHEDVGIHVQHVQIQSNTCIYKCSIYIEIYTY